MAAKKKKKAKRKAPAKRRANTKTKTKTTKRARSSDKFSQLTAAHARAVANGEKHFAQLIKKELTKKSRSRR